MVSDIVPQEGQRTFNGMVATGRSDRYKGREFECERCGETYWTCFGNAYRHDCEEGESDE